MTDRADAKKSRMAPRHDAPPGLEQDGRGNTIPIARRTRDDREKVRGEKPKTD